MVRQSRQTRQRIYLLCWLPWALYTLFQLAPLPLIAPLVADVLRTLIVVSPAAILAQDVTWAAQRRALVSALVLFVGLIEVFATLPPGALVIAAIGCSITIPVALPPQTATPALTLAEGLLVGLVVVLAALSATVMLTPTTPPARLWIVSALVWSFIVVVSGWLARSLWPALLIITISRICAYLLMSRWPAMGEMFDTVCWPVLATGLVPSIRDAASDAAPIPAWRGLMPRGAAGIGLTAAVVLPQTEHWMAIALLVSWSGFEALSTLAYHLAARRARTAQQRERDVTAQREQERTYELAGLIHDQAAPLLGIRAVILRLQKIATQQARESPGALATQLAGDVEQIEALVRLQFRWLRNEDRAPLAQRTSDLGVLVTQAVEALHALTVSQQTELTLEIIATELRIQGDETSVRRVLDNLLMNALATPVKSPLVHVQVWHERSHPETVTVTVRDRGSGISPERQATLFQPPPQLGEGAKLGIGLWNVATAMEQLGGKYDVVSVEGEGSQFWVRFWLVGASHATCPDHR